MIIQECVMELKEDVMYVSSELGNEYHAYGLIGNTALPYALGLIDVHYTSFKNPMHATHFRDLVTRDIYVTPATFIDDVTFKIERFNCIPDRYNITWGSDKGRSENYPDEGWFKMIARGNVAVFHVLSPNGVDIPRYVRIGKFMSKCKITEQRVNFTERDGSFTSDIILRAEDILPSIVLKRFEKIPIQHGMYLRSCEFNGRAIVITSNVMKRAIIPHGTGFYKAVNQ